MRRWDTPQKEGFAIYYALLKLDYLLRDRKFEVRTDHHNLSILRGDSYLTNLKVQRWLTTFQHYDFNINYVKGLDNAIADALSRHCAKIEFIRVQGVRANIGNDESSHFQTFLQVHNDLEGHMGAAETQRRIVRSNKQWPGMQRDIKRYLSLCPICQKSNQRKNTNIAFPFTVSSYKPFDTVQIDFIVNLNYDNSGYKHIMVIIDTFSRWIKLIPLKKINAEQAADALISYCGTFGFPKHITHNQDPVLMGLIVQEVIKLLGSKALPTMSYSKEENAIVERANKEILRHLRNFIFDNAAKQSYSRYVPFVERICNSAVHKLTGFSPAQIIFGNSVDLGRNTILEESYANTTEVSYSQWIQNLKDIQIRVISIARDNLKEHDELHLLNYPATQTELEVGSYVLVEYKNTFRRGPKSKLLPFLKGPYQIDSKDRSKYFLKDLITLKVKPYHIKRLTPYNFDPTKWDPLQVALRDSGDLFQVKRISDIKDNPKGPKNQLFFKVHWVGYSEQEATFEPWANITANIKLHDFFRSHKLKQVRDLLPSQFATSNERQEESESEDDFEN